VKITIITVSYNSSATIYDTLCSVVSQTHKDIEHLIIDGGSKDETIKIVESFRHPGLIMSSEPDKGIYDAMNKGLSRANGEIIGFLNSDDFYADSTALEKIASAFEDESVEACFGDLVYITQDNRREVRYWKSKPYVAKDFEKGWAPAHPTFYVRKSTFLRFGGFDLSFKLAADFDLMMRFLEVGKVKSKYIPFILVRMRLGGASNQSWSNIFKQNKEIYLSMKKNGINFNLIKFWVHKILNRSRQYMTASM
jgi:glycosyltransferase involved in cell wall biosynthesis